MPRLAAFDRIALDQRVGRAAHGAGDAQRAQQGAGQRGLAGAEIAVQMHHGRLRPGGVRIEASLRGGELWLEVEDDGAEGQPDQSGHGLGLANTRARLDALYGGRAALLIAPLPAGGTRVSLRLPRHGLATPAAAPAAQLDAVLSPARGTLLP